MKGKQLLIPLLLLLAACGDKPGREAADPEGLFAHLQISGEEGKDEVTCLLQFQQGDAGGEAQVLEPPGQALLDGEVLHPDSARLSGAYYEVQKPLQAFAGTHELVYNNGRRQPIRQEFSFQPFTLATPVGARVKRGDLDLQFNGLQPSDHLRVLLVDTSFQTDDINSLITLKNGRLHISRDNLSGTASGPVTLYLIKEEERPLRVGDREGGRIAITYSLKREFDLVD